MIGRTAEEIGKALRIDRRGRDDDAQLRALRQQPLQHAEQEIDVETAFVRFVDDQRVVAAQQPIVLELAQQDAVGHQLDAAVRAGAIGEAHLIAHCAADGRPQLRGQAIRDRARGDATRLRVSDQTERAATRFEADLRQLRRLARARRAADDDQLMLRSAPARSPRDAQ